jgi:hypothetical protein
VLSGHAIARFGIAVARRSPHQRSLGRLRHYNWSSWPAFLRTVRNMDLLLQPSYTESFSMVTGDAIGQGVRKSAVGKPMPTVP